MHRAALIVGRELALHGLLPTTLKVVQVLHEAGQLDGSATDAALHRQLVAVGVPIDLLREINRRQSGALRPPFHRDKSIAGVDSDRDSRTEI